MAVIHISRRGDCQKLFPIHVDLRVAHADGLLNPTALSPFANPEGRRHDGKPEARATSADFRHAAGQDLFTTGNTWQFLLLIILCCTARLG